MVELVDGLLRFGQAALGAGVVVARRFAARVGTERADNLQPAGAEPAGVQQRSSSFFRASNGTVVGKSIPELERFLERQSLIAHQSWQSQAMGRRSGHRKTEPAAT